MGSPLQKVMQEILRVPEMCGDKLAGVQCIMCLCVSTFHAEHFQRKQKKKSSLSVNPGAQSRTGRCLKS